MNKPSGMLVHRGWDNDPVVAMTALRDQLGRYVYPVHRLDRPTSGALVFALHQEAARTLSNSFREAQVRKAYIALVRGVAPEHGIVDNPVPNKPKGARVPAQTSFERIHIFERYSVVACWPKTGRLHQIRRHLKHISHPLIGDVNYGKGEHNRIFRDRFNLHRLALHAGTIAFSHPATNEALTIEAPIPQDFAETLRAIGMQDEQFRLATQQSFIPVNT